MSGAVILTNTLAEDGSEIILELDVEDPRSEALRSNWKRDDYRNKRLKKMQGKMGRKGLLRKCTIVNMFTGEQRQFDTPSHAGNYAKINTKKIYRCTQGLSYGHKQYVVRYCEPTPNELQKYKQFDKTIHRKISVIDENGPILDDADTNISHTSTINTTRVFKNMFEALLYLHEEHKEEMDFYKMFIAVKRSGTYNNYMINPNIM